MKQFKGKKVLVFGLGLNQGGVGSAKFFSSLGAKIRVTDLKTADVLKPSIDQLGNYQIEYVLGKHRNEDIDWADLVIKNPAVKPGNTYIEYALKKRKKVEQDMGIFLDYVKPSHLIGVTGTKGKSTTASLIYEVLKNDGRDVVFAGNIGTSVLDTVPFVKRGTLVVLEISSFQLESFESNKVSPKWAVITNITPDHLNYYSSMDEYTQSKIIIGKYQTKDDFLFIRKDDPVIDNLQFLDGLKGKIIRFSKDDLPKSFKPNLMGEHNLENIAAALAVMSAFDIPKDKALQTLASFQGVPFRMELIKEWCGVKIYNDTTATGPDAGIQTIKTLASHIGSGNVVLICGGMNKGMDYTKYAAIASKFVKKIFFIKGDATDLILLSLRGAKGAHTRKVGTGNLDFHGPYNDLEQLLTDVRKDVKPGDIILFSPAATSFNLFQNEFDRGRKFNIAVEKVFVE